MQRHFAEVNAHVNEQIGFELHRPATEQQSRKHAAVDGQQSQRAVFGVVNVRMEKARSEFPHHS